MKSYHVLLNPLLWQLTRMPCDGHWPGETSCCGKKTESSLTNIASARKAPETTRHCTGNLKLGQTELQLTIDLTYTNDFTCMYIYHNSCRYEYLISCKIYNSCIVCIYIYITPCTQPAFYAVIDSYHAIACTLPLRSFFSELLMPFLRWFKTSQDISTWTTALPAPS